MASKRNEALFVISLYLILDKGVVSARKGYEPYTVTAKDFHEFFPEPGDNQEDKFHLQPIANHEDFDLDELLKPRPKKIQNFNDDENSSYDNSENAAEFHMESDDEEPDSSKEDKEGEAFRRELGIGEFWRENSNPRIHRMSGSSDDFRLTYDSPEADSFETDNDDFDESDSDLDRPSKPTRPTPPNKSSKFKPSPIFNPSSDFDSDSFKPIPDPAFRGSYRSNEVPTSRKPPQRQALHTTVRVGNTYVVKDGSPGRPRQLLIKKTPVNQEPKVILRPVKNQKYHLSPQKRPNINNKPITTTSIVKSEPEYVYHSIEEFKPELAPIPLPAPPNTLRPNFFRPKLGFPTNTPPYSFEKPSIGFGNSEEHAGFIGRPNGLDGQVPHTIASPLVRPSARPFSFRQTRYEPEFHGRKVIGAKFHYQPSHEEASHVPNYKYHYFVNDPQTNDVKSQWELRDGDLVNGAYSLVEPDGVLRVVEYTADPDNGFRALVKRISRSEHGDIEERQFFG